MSRAKTTELLAMVEEGLIDKDTLILALVNYMSEDEVAEMMRLNDIGYDGD
jgi:hypothetical protein